MIVYKFLSEGWGLDNLRKRRIKISRFLELNDPFELMALDTSDRSIRKRFNGWVKNEMDPKFGIISFSRGWDNPVLWSHYAESHKGICLGFDIPDKYPQKVNYTSERLFTGLTETSLPKILNEDFGTKLVSTKFAHWEYEDEYRVHYKLNDVNLIKEGNFLFDTFSEDVSFADLKLRKVIVGCRSTISRKKLSNALGEELQNVETFKARPAFKSFRMIKNENGKLWK